MEKSPRRHSTHVKQCPPCQPTPTRWPSLPLRDAGADGVDSSGDFVTRHTWILQAGPETILHDHVAVADAAGFDVHADLARTGFGEGALDQFPITASFADLCGFHRGSHEFLLLEAGS